MPGRILIVDDSDDTREMMAKLLELESYSVITAEDGRAALAAANLERPDLIITDINMPNLNGLDLIRILREQPEFSRTPILAITAYGSRMASEALAAGADQATTKPVEFDALITDIKRLLGEKLNGCGVRS